MDEGSAREVVGSPHIVAAAHELKAPLALIRQLSLELESGDYTKLERTILQRRITLTTERALRLTTDLSRAKRLDDGLFACEPLNPLTLCEEVAQEISPLYRAHNRRFQVASRRHSLPRCWSPASSTPERPALVHPRRSPGQRTSMR